MNCCVTILLNTSIQIWTSFILLFILHYLDLILPQQFQPFYPKQKMVMSTSFKFYDVFLSQILECSIPTQLNTSHAKDWYRHKPTKLTGEDKPAGSSCSVQAQEDPVSAKDLTRAQKTNCGQLSVAWANSSLCFITTPSHLARIAQNSNKSTPPDWDKTIASQFSPLFWTRKLRNLASTGACWIGASSSPRWNLMKALQPSNQKMAGSLKLYKEPPNESSAVEWKSGSSRRVSIPSHPTTSTTTDGGSAFL